LTPRHLSSAEAAALEARFGLRVAARLQGGSLAVGHDIEERLRIARLQAMDQARRAASKRRQPSAAPRVPSTEIVQMDPSFGAVALRGGQPEQEEAWWMRLGILIPLLLLVAGLIGIDEWRASEQISATAEIDAALLGDELPPAAYTDPGFSEFLVTPLPPSAAQE
jgi:hypothetical protein